MPTLVVDAGDLLAPYPNLLPSEKTQRRIKAELILETLAKTGVDAMTPGRPDFAFGPEFLVNAVRGWGLPYVCANLIDEASGEPLFPATRLVQVGDIPVGVFGLMGKGYLSPGLEVTDPIQAATGAVAQLREQGAVLIVALSNQPAPDNDMLAEQVKGIDIIVAGSSHRKLDPPGGDRDTLILEPGSKGKYLGVLELYLSHPGDVLVDLGKARRLQERAERFRRRAVAVQARLKVSTRPREQKRLRRQLELYKKEIEKAEKHPESLTAASGYINRIIPLSRAIPDDPEVAALVSRALTQVHEATLNGATSGGQKDQAPSRGVFAGADRCAACHAQEYEQWRRTAHARAYETLVEARRSLDYQCFGCHVTGHGVPGGPKTPWAVGFLEGVQCEACHGPGRAHAENPETPLPGGTIDEALCRTCHTREQTGNRFDFDAYYPRILHDAEGAEQLEAGHETRGTPHEATQGGPDG